MKPLTLKQKLRRAELKQKRYRECADYRLAAINRTRANDGRPTLASLEQSAKLRLRIPASQSIDS